MNRVSKARVARAFVSLWPHAPHTQLVQALAEIIISQHWVHELDQFLDLLAAAYGHQTGRLPVHITTAHALPLAARTEIQKAVQTALQVQHVEADVAVDEKLIGGFVATAPGREIDASVRSSLYSLISYA